MADTRDVAVIGGGLAGGIAAGVLAQRGVDVVVFEKESHAHHKVCGEFISAEGVAMIEALGLDLMKLGAVPITGFRLHSPRFGFEARLPHRALGLSRAALDEALLVRAAELGAAIHRGEGVREVSGSIKGAADAEVACARGEFTVTTVRDTPIRARRVVIATGKTEFKSVQQRAGRDSGWVGFKMHVRLAPAAARRLRGFCDLFVFPHGYGGLAPVEDGIVNCCLLIEKEAVRRIGTDWSAIALHVSRSNPEVARYLDSAEPCFERCVTTANIPYGFVRHERPAPGVFCVGDQMAVIPSLTGAGMTIAALTAVTAAETIADHQGRLRAASCSVAYHERARASVRRPVEIGFLLHRLFKNPRACDWACRAGAAMPGVARYLVAKTRVRAPGGDGFIPRLALPP